MFEKMNTLRFPLILLMAVTSFFMVSCSKDDDDQKNLASKEYKLANGATEIGKVTISEKADGSARLAIQFNSGALINGATFKASIISVVGADEFLYAKQLTDVNGTTGAGVTDPVKDAVTDVAIPYATLVSKTGYVVKITTVPAGVEYARATL
jgi:hypothetical protein